MRFDIHLRSDVKDKIAEIVNDIQTWNAEDSTIAQEIEKLSTFVCGFDHCATPDSLFMIMGADGSGDFPCVTYGDSFVYLVTAVCRLYKAASDGRLIETDIHEHSLVDFAWLPEDKKQSDKQLDLCFEKIVGHPLLEICQISDYLQLAKANGGKSSSSTELLDSLIRPEAHDAHNLEIQIRTVAELAVLARTIEALNNNQRG